MIAAKDDNLLVHAMQNDRILDQVGDHFIHADFVSWK